MHIDTSSTVGRIDHLRAAQAARSQPFNQIANVNGEQTAGASDSAEDIAAKRRAQLTPPASQPTTLIRTERPQTSTTPTTLVRTQRPQAPDNPTTNIDQKPSVSASPNQPDNPINSLLADWGKSDSNYDLNSDGTVNTEDLLMLLENLAAQENRIDTTADNTTITNVPTLTTADPLRTDNPDDLISFPGKPANRIDALLADWGKTDSSSDYNKDGTVNTDDLLMLLSKLAQATSSEVANDGTIGPNRSSSDGPLPPDYFGGIVTKSPNDPVQALLNDWGKTDSANDYNGDGTVNTSDLLMLLAKLGQSDEVTRTEGPAENQTIATAPSDMQRSAPGEIIEEVNPKIQQMARGLAERLFSLHDRDQDGNIGIKEAGKARAIFSNIDVNNDLQIDKLELANNIQDLFMGRISQDSSANLNQFISETLQLFTGRSEENTSVNRAYQRINTDQTASELSQRLTDNGASELRRFLNNADYSATQKRSILSQLHSLNLGHLGVNVVG